MNDEIAMKNDELPDSWIRAPFSSVTVDPIQRVPSEKEKITYIDIGSVDRDTKTIVEPQSMLGKDAPSRARKVIQAGDVLVSTVRPNLNAVAVVESQYDGQFASTGFDVLRSPVVDPRWLFYAVRTPEFLDRMSELVQGALYPAVRSKDIRSFVIPIAPLAEQKRIADKLEAVLGRVDACRARLDRVPALLKRFRQSVLASATSGGLTAEWRISKSVNDEWENLKLGQLVAEPLRNGKSVRDGKGIPVLRLTALRGGKFDWREAKQGDWTGLDPTRFFVKDGDFLIIRGNGSQDLVGRGCLAENPPDEMAFPDTLIRIRPDKDKLLPPYLVIVWNTSDVRSQIEQAAKTTTGLWKVAQGDLESISIPLPPLPEQQEIVRRVEALFAMADRIEVRLANAQKTVERLTPATLAKAFRGELVPQDSNDEPASALLKRFCGSESATPQKKSQRKAAKSA